MDKQEATSIRKDGAQITHDFVRLKMLCHMKNIIAQKAAYETSVDQVLEDSFAN